MPEDVLLNVSFDESSYVHNAISGLANGWLGELILVVALWFLFPGNFRSTLIVSISLPLSLLFAFQVLYFTGQAVNRITLGGACIGFAD